MLSEKFLNLLTSLTEQLSFEKDGAIADLVEKLEMFIANPDSMPEDADRILKEIFDQVDEQLLMYVIDAENRVLHMNHLRHGVELLLMWLAKETSDESE